MEQHFLVKCTGIEIVSKGLKRAQYSWKSLFHSILLSEFLGEGFIFLNSAVS